MDRDPADDLFKEKVFKEEDGRGESSPEDAGKFTPPPPSGMLAIFLGPDGVRAGWRAALYLALFLLFLVTLQSAAQILHHGIFCGAHAGKPFSFRVRANP